eukprot:superscaffoldBa00002478_g14409
MYVLRQPAGPLGQGHSSPSATEMGSDVPGDQRGTCRGLSCGQLRAAGKLRFNTQALLDTRAVVLNLGL